VSWDNRASTISLTLGGVRSKGKGCAPTQRATRRKALCRLCALNTSPPRSATEHRIRTIKVSLGRRVTANVQYAHKSGVPSAQSSMWWVGGWQVARQAMTTRVAPCDTHAVCSRRQPADDTWMAHCATHSLALHNAAPPLPSPATPTAAGRDNAGSALWPAGRPRRAGSGPLLSSSHPLQPGKIRLAQHQGPGQGVGLGGPTLQVPYGQICPLYTDNLDPP
jgi:hypothetical protein